MSTDHLFRRSELEGTGLRPERDPSLSRERRSVYASSADLEEGATARYLRKVRASHLTLTGAHVCSHESAAALLGLPMLGAWPDRVHLIDERRTGGRSQLDVVRHCVGLEHVDPVVVDGMLVTSPARTAFDLALSRPFELGVVVADAVIRDWPGAAEELRALADAYGRRRGWQRLGRVLAFMDARSGSAGESLSRCRIDALGFIRPELQVPITTDGRTEFGDFGWEEVLGLGEFDGEVKYRLDRYRQGGSVEDVVIREKSRENRLRRQRPRFARWDWTDLLRDRLESILVAAGIPKRSRGARRPVPVGTR
ncbi:hypothetical protein [Amnibacterium endophyticum]|uniref:AbiEi antitoxin C-terminal domain-containing protein n=1 Tax=Amnibacterium endophyticum TaxID=2109337 RepID=A0ABW4LC93_9MICO